VPKNVKRIDPSVFVILGIIAVLVSVTTVILVNVRTDRLTGRLEQNPQLPLVLMISDEQGLISTQLLLIDSNTGNLASYDFPRRLGAIIPALGRVDRIDNLYDELGPEELVNTLANIVNMDIEFLS
jgi:hypothetical protein